MAMNDATASRGSLHIFLDLDGTVVTSAQTVPDSARRALSRARELGHHLYICTGRSAPEIYPWLWELGFDGMVGSNGAYVRVGDTVVRDERMMDEDVEWILAFLARHHAGSVWVSPDAVYSVDNYLDKFHHIRNSDAASNRGDSEGDTESSDWAAYLDLVAPYVRQARPVAPAKVTFTIPHGAGLGIEDIRRGLGSRFSLVPGSIDTGDGETYELVTAGTTKAVGMLAVLDCVGVGVEAAVAVGDSPNDLEMIEAAGLGIAMGNATASIRAAAQLVAPPIGQDGLARGLVAAGVIDRY